MTSPEPAPKKRGPRRLDPGGEKRTQHRLFCTPAEAESCREHLAAIRAVACCQRAQSMNPKDGSPLSASHLEQALTRYNAGMFKGIARSNEQGSVTIEYGDGTRFDLSVDEFTARVTSEFDGDDPAMASVTTNS